MQYIQGISRHHLQLSSLEDKITADNPVRFINHPKLNLEQSRRTISCPADKTKTWLLAVDVITNNLI